jgi:hypothetical protein
LRIRAGYGHLVPLSMPAIALVVTALLGLAMLAGCGSDGDDESEPETAETSGTETTATSETEPTETTATNEFGEGDAEAARIALEGVINRDIGDPAYHIDGFRSDPAVSADLIAQIDQLQDEARAKGGTGLGFDPFLCAQNIPTGVTYNELGAAADRITFVGLLKFGGSQEKVTYVVFQDVDDRWKLDATECVDAALPRGEQPPGP